MTDPQDTMRWVWRGSVAAALVIGWLFVAWQNHFHISAPVVFVCLGYLAVVATVYNLWRTGAAAVAAGDDVDDSTWAKPAGALGELEREKRTLLKAIKEAEFDHQMGKLSKHDVDDMVRTYRARAIEVIKEIDQLGLGAAGSAREKILREVRARLELEGRSQKKPAGDPRQAAKTRTDDREASQAKLDKLSKQARKAHQAGESLVAEFAAGGAPIFADGAAPAPSAAVANDAATVEAAAAASTDDEAMDADSTTTVGPTRDDPAKEATP